MTMTDNRPNTVIGTRLLRREDPALLTGEGKFTNDLSIPGALHLAIKRSEHAHARIIKIDTTQAKALPGVVAVYTGAELQSLWAAPMPCAWPVTPDMKNPAHYPLAVSKVHYVGDGVAAVLATFGIVLAALYILIPVQKALHGPTTPGNENLPDLNLREKFAVGPVLAIIIALGFYPAPLLNVINPVAAQVIESQGFTDPVPSESAGK